MAGVVGMDLLEALLVKLEEGAARPPVVDTRRHAAGKGKGKGGKKRGKRGKEEEEEAVEELATREDNWVQVDVPSRVRQTSEGKGTKGREEK